MLGTSVIAALLGTAAPLFMLQGMSVPTETLARGTVHALVLSARGAMDLRYEGIVYDERTSAVSLRGVTLVPPAGAAAEGCVIEADSLGIVPTIRTDGIGLSIEMDAVSATPDCAAEAGMVVAMMLGPDALGADRATVDLDYEMGDSSLDMAVFVDTARTGTVDLSLSASGLHVISEEVPNEDPDALPFEKTVTEQSLGGTLDSFELTADDLDGLRALLPALGIEEDAAPDLVAQVRGGLGEVADNAAGKVFVDSVETELDRFLKQGGALTLRMTRTSVPLETLFDTAGPEETVPLLAPVMTARPAAAGSILPIALLRKNTEDLTATERRRIAEAFATGIGIPRSRDRALELYGDLAEEGDGEAALAAAMLLVEEDAPRAYAMALDAGAAGVPGARLALDRIEADLELEDVMELQQRGEAPEPVADIATLRARARAALEGRGARRDYRAALRDASLAAAAGDRASARLYDRLAARFEGEEGWSETLTRVSDEALEIWADGLGEAFAEGE